MAWEWGEERDGTGNGAGGDTGTPCVGVRPDPPSLPRGEPGGRGWGRGWGLSRLIYVGGKGIKQNKKLKKKKQQGRKKKRKEEGRREGEEREKLPK